MRRGFVSSTILNIMIAVTSTSCVLGGLEGYARFVYGGKNYNEKGFYSRGVNYSLKKPANTFRIVCIGGSTTFGGSNYRQTYPFYLGKALREKSGKGSVEVVNSGIAGAGTEFERDIVCERIGDGDLDLLIIHSFYNHFSPFYPNNSDAGVRKIILESHRVKMVYDWNKMRILDIIKVVLIERSYLYNLLREQLSKITNKESGTYLSKKAGYLLKYSGKKEYNVGTDIEFENTLNDFLGRYRKGVEDMIIAAKSRNIEAVLILPPYPLFGEERRDPVNGFRFDAKYSKVYDLAMDILKSLGAKYGLTVIDVNSEFIRSGRSADLFLDSIHLSPKGELLLARIIADRLENDISVRIKK